MRWNARSKAKAVRGPHRAIWYTAVMVKTLEQAIAEVERLRWLWIKPAVRIGPFFED
jgi:hypothetical protein